MGHLGEITVLAAAATGVASLIFLQQRDRRGGRLADVQTGSVGRINSEGSMGTAVLRTVRRFSTEDSATWLEAGRTLAPERRSIVLEVITRMLFHAMVLYSIYLLLAGHNTPGGVSPAACSPVWRSRCATWPAVGTSCSRPCACRPACCSASVWRSRP